MSFGWSNEACAHLERIVFEPNPEIDTFVIRQPVSDGYVTYDD